MHLNLCIFTALKNKMLSNYQSSNWLLFRCVRVFLVMSDLKSICYYFSYFGLRPRMTNKNRPPLKPTHTQIPPPPQAPGVQFMESCLESFSVFIYTTHLHHCRLYYHYYGVYYIHILYYHTTITPQPQLLPNHKTNPHGSSIKLLILPIKNEL